MQVNFQQMHTVSLEVLCHRKTSYREISDQTAHHGQIIQKYFFPCNAY